MRAAGDDPDGIRLRGLIVVLWRAGLRVSEALALAESDLEPVRGAIQVRHGNGGRRREVGMDRWAWEALDPWLNVRAGLPVGALFCLLRGPTRGRPCSAAGVRVQLRNAAIAAGVRRRFAPHHYADPVVMPMCPGAALPDTNFAMTSRHNPTAARSHLPLDVGDKFVWMYPSVARAS